MRRASRCWRFILSQKLQYLRTSLLENIHFGQFHYQRNSASGKLLVDRYYPMLENFHETLAKKKHVRELREFTAADSTVSSFLYYCESGCWVEEPKLGIQQMSDKFFQGIFRPQNCDNAGLLARRPRQGAFREPIRLHSPQPSSDFSEHTFCLFPTPRDLFPPCSNISLCYHHIRH